MADVVELVAIEKTPENFEFALAVKKEALGPHVIPRWGWDDALQRRTHSERWSSRRFFRIVRGGASIGTVSFDEKEDHVELAEFYILPAYQQQGIGSHILATILRDAKTRELPVRLRCLKWNPALSLYKRHGFEVTGDTDTHYLMEWGRPGP